MNTRLNISKLYLLKFYLRLNVTNSIKDSFILWYSASLSLLNALIDDSYYGENFGLECLIKFVSKNPKATNIDSYLKSLPEMPDELFSLSRDRNETTYNYHGYLTMTLTEHMYNVDLIYNDLDNSLFFKNNTLEFNGYILKIENGNLKLMFSVSADSNIVLDSIIDGNNSCSIDLKFPNQESFFNYIKNYETIPFDKNLIHMIYF